MKKEAEKIDKVVVSVGVGKLRGQPHFEEKILPNIRKELALISGQAPASRQAKKSIAGFKIRAGDIVGLQITLRRHRMKDFLDRLIHLVLPRVKDFRGLELSAIDGRGNLNIGLKEQFVFPEVSADQSIVSFGLQITIVPKVRERDQAIDLYRSIGVPLKK